MLRNASKQILPHGSASAAVARRMVSCSFVLVSCDGADITTHLPAVSPGDRPFSFPGLNLYDTSAFFAISGTDATAKPAPRAGVKRHRVTNFSGWAGLVTSASVD